MLTPLSLPLGQLIIQKHCPVRAPSPLLHRINFYAVHQSNAKKAVVINEGRGQAGFAAAELLIKKGTSVEMISSDIAVGNDIDPTNRTAWYIRLGEQGCVFTSAQTLVRVVDKQLQCRNVYDGRSSYREDIDLIIDWQGCRVNKSLNGLLETAERDVFHIGDCVTPRNVEIAN